jgi:Fic-DOC domain mobile mystery protein B
MGLDLYFLDGQTPLEEDEKEDLLIKSISTRGELDEFEQANILEALEWSLRMHRKMDEVLSIAFIQEVHQRMFSEVWTWAGCFRTSNKNLGVDKHSIQLELHKLNLDCRYWIENRVYSEDEIAIRYKYRMVFIHPFPNGNGRHSRICGDILASKVLERPVFSWGGQDIGRQGETREKYLKALKHADKGDFGALIDFARSG